MRAMPDPDDKAETAGASCRDASRCILENYGARRQYSETARGFQEHVRSGFPAQMHTVKIDAIDAASKNAVKRPACRISVQWRLDEATANARVPHGEAPRQDLTPVRPRAPAAP
jgi:hypothetical protein